MFIRILMTGLVFTIIQALLLFPAVDSLRAQCEDPDTLTISIIPTEESIQEFSNYKPIIEYLAENTGKKIEVYVPVSYSNVIDAMTKKRVDVAIFGPYSYTIASAIDPDIHVFATVAKNAGYIQEAGPGYKSVLISRKGSKFISIESLEKAKVDMVDPVSTSGNLVPRVIFSRLVGHPLETFFGKIVYSGGHDLAALAVYEGEVDAAFVATHRFDNVIERGMVQKEYYNYLWYSEVIPQDPVTYRNSLCPDLKRKIEETFLTCHIQKSSRRFLTNINAERFVKIVSEDYDVIRELKKVVDKEKIKPR